MHNQTVFEHIGAARLYCGTVRIDIKTMQAVIGQSDITLLMGRYPVNVFDISDVMKTAGSPSPIGRAWITRSGKAVLYQINGLQYVSPLSQVKGIITGERKYANVSIIREAASHYSTTSSPAAEVSA
jgi:hypothetical protein